MLTSFLIMLREGLEAIFIVTIVLSIISRLKRHDLRIYVWMGILLAIICSVFAGIILQLFSHSLAGEQKAIFQGTLMIVACMLLTYVMIWFNAQAKLLKNKFEDRIIQVISGNHSWRIFTLVFLAVFREGIEIVIFLSAALVTRDAIRFMIGGGIGLICVLILGNLIYRGSLKVPFKHFFRITSVILILVAAGLLLQGVGQLQTSNILPTWCIGTVSFKNLLNDQTGVGLVLHILFGYDSNPTFLMLISYFGYLLMVISLKRWWTDRALNRLVQKSCPI